MDLNVCMSKYVAKFIYLENSKRLAFPCSSFIIEKTNIWWPLLSQNSSKTKPTNGWFPLPGLPPTGVITGFSDFSTTYKSLVLVKKMAFFLLICWSRFVASTLVVLVDRSIR